MVQKPADFLKLAAGLFNYKFGGDPLKLEGFLADVDLVVSVSTADTKDICFKFIKAKLEGRAQECIPDDANTVDNLKTNLKKFTSNFQ